MKTKKLNRFAVWAAVLFFMGTLFPYAYGAADKALKQLRTFVDVMEYIKENYVENTDTDKLIAGAIKGVVGELDDFSQYLPPKDYKDLKNETKGEFGGLGIRLQKLDGFVTIMSPMPGTPAFKAGVMPGDRIVMVDGKDVTALKLDETVEMMRGEVGSKVKITISRKDTATGEYKNLPDFNFKREKIVPEVVYYRLLPGQVGYLYMVDFSGHSTEEVQKALKDLTKQGMKSLVLDLRFNPGGLLTGAVDISKLFMGDEQLVVYTKGRKPEYYQEFFTAKAAPYADIPMIVLANQSSASASEIVSGALQDNKRAVVVGTRTFGKASVQQVLPLEGGAGLRLTIAKYYTPLGRLIHRDHRDEKQKDQGGIVPDVDVQIEPEEEFKIFMQYNKIVYTPGQDNKPHEFTEKDPALDVAVELLTGKITLSSAQERAKKQAEAATKKKEAAIKKKEAAAKKEASKTPAAKAQDKKGANPAVKEEGKKADMKQTDAKKAAPAKAPASGVKEEGKETPVSEVKKEIKGISSPAVQKK